jgi:hypothetical protein
MKRISTLISLALVALSSSVYAQQAGQPDWTFMRGAQLTAPAPMNNSTVNNNANFNANNNRVGHMAIIPPRDGWEHVLVPPCGFVNNDKYRYNNPPSEWLERERQWQERETYTRRLAENNLLVSKLVNDKQDAQIDSVYEGVRENKINREEFLALMVDQKAIRQLERSYTQDGTWTQDEFNNIMRELDKVEVKLSRFKQAGWGQ